MIRSIQIRSLPFMAALVLLSVRLMAQGCCSGGSGSPLAGGTSQGVLQDRQAEIGMNYQYIRSNKFLTGDKPAMDFLDNYKSQYIYTRFGYGVTEKLTMSVEAGYFANRDQVSLKKRDTVSSHGVGDLIIFPRYSIYTHNTEKTRNEITVGLGYKFPLGKYHDSSVVYTDPSTGKQYYTAKPPAVLPTTGSNDFIFYGFGYRGYPAHKFRLFTSLLYVRKGWNPLGQKFGDYASIGLFAGKTIYKNLGITMQLKGEWVDKMRADNNIDMLALYNVDIQSTGGVRLLAVPQISYSYKSFSGYLLSEIPLYQYINGTAIASQYLFTIGLSYRFLTYKTKE